MSTNGYRAAEWAAEEVVMSDVSFRDVCVHIESTAGNIRADCQTGRRYSLGRWQAKQAAKAERVVKFENRFEVSSTSAASISTAAWRDQQSNCSLRGLHIVPNGEHSNAMPFGDRREDAGSSSSKEVVGRWPHSAYGKHVIGADVCSKDSYTYAARETTKFGVQSAICRVGTNAISGRYIELHALETDINLQSNVMGSSIVGNVCIVSQFPQASM